MKLKFTENGIWDEDCNKCGDDGFLIMHVDHTDYEHAVADFITKENYNILEIGYGMGISARRIQTLKPAKHIIIEKVKEIYDKGVEWAKDIDNVTLIHGDYKNEIGKLTDKFDGIYHSADKETVNRLLSFKDDIKSLAKENCKLVMLNWHINPTLINKANYKNVTTSNDFKSRWKEPETFMVYTTLIDNDWKADDVNTKYTWIM